MAVDWNSHRFSGIALALCVTNTVVHRRDTARRFDRFDDADEIARFAGAAALHCAGELGGRGLAVTDLFAIRPRVLALREATDALFRSAAEDGGLESGMLAALLAACAEAMPAGVRLGSTGRPFGEGATPLAFDTAVAISALSLLPAERFGRIRVCPNCDWLFIDRSRNASRLWCDMKVCGNREKARRHYRRRIGEREVGYA